MPITLKHPEGQHPLPALSSLSPLTTHPLSPSSPSETKQETFEYHWGKHHAAYITNLNNQIKGTDMEKMTLEQVMLKTWNGGKPTGEFNNAAQCVNHQFFWESMAPNAGGQPSGALSDAITKDFGSYDAFKDAFKAAGATQFGSGWAWLCVGDGGKLEVIKTPNAENPMCVGKKPILTMDGK